uniref:Putative RNA-dependent RNA-polymerase n=1 Tax=Black Hill virus TaxID=2511030 RepID=A0A411D3B5_9VIRU|nr:putative RNA-dependent RNA-polymerase [Black Hill virus]
MRRKETLRKNGIIPITPFIDTLKDERKRPEKVRKLGGTRVFCNPPLDFVIQCRQNYLHLCAAAMKNRFTQGHAVGINVAGSEWTMLANRLLKVSNNICTLDYSNFGPGFNAGVAERVLQLFNRWLKANVEGVDGTELEAMAYELVYSTHICANTVYHQKAGSPSGAPITTIINSYVNLFYISCAWLMMFDREVGENCTIWEEFREKVCVFVYGDDLIMAISDEIKDKFNAQTISAFFARFNIVATDSTKSENIIPYDTLDNSSFLKHSFQHHVVFAGVWQSALGWTSVQDCTQWVWECADYKMATYENCKMAIMLAHGHGRHKFEEFKNRVNTALARVGCSTVVLSWDEIDRMSYPDLYGV